MREGDYPDEFEALALYMKGVKINLNTTAADKHVLEIERPIRVVKECAHSVWNNLQFDHLLNVMIVELIQKVIMWFNAFPVVSGVSVTYSPRSIMTGTALDFTKHCRIEFGAYVDTHESPHPTNTMDTRKMPCLNLGPTGNLQGTHKFLNICTGHTVNIQKWTEPPIS